VARRLTRDDDDAEDLLQATAVRAHRFAEHLRQGTSMRAWLHRILRNTFASRYRKRRREREVLQRAHLEGALGEPARGARAGVIDEPAVVAASISDELLSALDNLQPEFRAVLTLVIIDGLSYREAADALGCPIGTVMSRLHRARSAMLAQLRDPNPHAPRLAQAPRGQSVKAPPKARARAGRDPRPSTENAALFVGFAARRAA